MPKKALELERIILSNGWRFVRQTGSHRHYKHDTIPGIITIPFHPGDITKVVENSVLKKAGLK